MRKINERCYAGMGSYLDEEKSEIGKPVIREDAPQHIKELFYKEQEELRKEMERDFINK